MQDLIKQEQFELEVLDRLNSGKLLNGLVFLGGTMLRLCYGLNRFSVDLDFWLHKEVSKARLFKSIKKSLSEHYTIRDAANKFNTLLFEIKSANYPRSLKIEIRKEKKRLKTEQAIAYSKHSNIQVFIRALTLNEMMQAKVDALLNREEIRDAFDMEFLLKKGATLNAPEEKLKLAIKIIKSFSKRDYQVKLGSLLYEEQRKYYAAENFKILISAINEKLVVDNTRR